MHSVFEYSVIFLMYVQYVKIFLCFLSSKTVVLFVLTFWCLTHVLFLWMVAVSLWLSHATGQHTA